MSKTSVLIGLGYIYIARPILKALAESKDTQLDEEAIKAIDSILGVAK